VQIEQASYEHKDLVELFRKDNTAQ
jgi:hypothetical protein